MDIPAAKVRKVLKIARVPISLETPIGEEGDSHLGDLIEDRAVVSPAAAAMNRNSQQADSYLAPTGSGAGPRTLPWPYTSADTPTSCARASQCR